MVGAMEIVTGHNRVTVSLASETVTAFVTGDIQTGLIQIDLATTQTRQKVVEILLFCVASRTGDPSSLH